MTEQRNVKLGIPNPSHTVEISAQRPLDQSRAATILSKAIELKTRIRSGTSAETIEGYLGRGTNGVAFLIDGMVAKISEFDNLEHVQSEIARLEKAKGEPRIVQIATANVEQGIIVTELLPGASIQSLNLEVTPIYREHEVLLLIDTVIQLHARGLAIDPKPGNFMHDDSGFYILDPLDANSALFPLADQVMGLMHMLTFKGSYRQQTDQQILDDETQRYQTMIQLLTLIKNHHPTLFKEIKGKNRTQLSKYGTNGGYLKEGMFDDTPNVVTLREEIETILAI